MRWRSQEPSVSAADPCHCAVGRLRTMFTMAEGEPAPRSRPVAPRSTSTRSSMAVSGWMKVEAEATWFTLSPST